MQTSTNNANSEYSKEAPLKVSVVMPMYNALPYIEESIKSVIKQTHKNWELLIIDDCSSDGCTDVAKQFSAKDDRIKYLKNSQQSGVSYSRNVALEHASGQFIAFLDSDDQWLPEKLEKQLSFSLENNESITYCRYFRINEAGKILGVVNPAPKINYKSMLYKNHIGTLTAMYDKRRLGHVRFKPVRHEDYIFWLEAIKLAGSAKLVQSEEPLARYLVHKSSLSGNKFQAAKWQWDNYRINLGFSFFKSIYFFIFYAINSILKRI